MQILKKYVSLETQFIDPSVALLTAIKKWRLQSGLGGDEFLTTGDASAMKRAARSAFGVTIPGAKRVRL